MQEIIFNVFPWETRAYVFEFGALKNVFVEWADDANVSGNIYEGRVDSISPSLGAAFLDIGAHRKAFLELSKKPQVFLNDKGKSNFQNCMKIHVLSTARYHFVKNSSVFIRSASGNVQVTLCPKR